MAWFDNARLGGWLSLVLLLCVASWLNFRSLSVGDSHDAIYNQPSCLLALGVVPASNFGTLPRDLPILAPMFERLAP